MPNTRYYLTEDTELVLRSCADGRHEVYLAGRWQPLDPTGLLLETISEETARKLIGREDAIEEEDRGAA